MSYNSKKKRKLSVAKQVEETRRNNRLARAVIAKANSNTTKGN